MWINVTVLCAIPLLLDKVWLVFDIFSTTFWWFHCIWPIRLKGLWEAELSEVGKPTWCLLSPLPTVLTFWLVSSNGSQQKAVRCHKLIKTLAKWQWYAAQHCETKQICMKNSTIWTEKGHNWLWLWNPNHSKLALLEHTDSLLIQILAFSRSP